MRRVWMPELAGPEVRCDSVCGFAAERFCRVLRLGLGRFRGPPGDSSSFGFAPAPANVRPIFEGFCPRGVAPPCEPARFGGRGFGNPFRPGWRGFGGVSEIKKLENKEVKYYLFFFAKKIWPTFPTFYYIFPIWV